MKKKKLSWHYIYTVEHRKYAVKAEYLEAAYSYLEEQANLKPLDKRVKLLEIGEFTCLEQ